MEAGEISYATMLKLGRVNPALAASVTPSSSLSLVNQALSPIRTGLTYNQAVKANVVCNLVSVGTGCPSGTNMENDITDTLSNPGSLKQIAPTPLAQIDKEQAWETSKSKVANLFTWVTSAPVATQQKILELTEKYLYCIEKLEAKYTAPPIEEEGAVGGPGPT